MRLLGGVVLLAALAGAAWAAKGKGKAVPQPLRRALWAAVCDAPDAEPCAAPAAGSGGSTFPTSAMPGQGGGGGGVPKGCIRRTDGSLVKPYRMKLVHFHYADPTTGAMTSMAKEQSGKAPEQYSGLRVLFEMASGVKLNKSKEEYGLLYLNPDVVAWFEANLVPPPGEAMCGTTARAVYQAVLSQSVRAYAEAYVYLADAKALKSVKLADYAKQRDDNTGSYVEMCTKLSAEKEAYGYEVEQACHFWLRRAVSGGAEPLAAALGRFLAAYDPSFHGPRAGKFPKK